MIDVSTDAYLARMAVVEAMGFISRPSAVYRPDLYADGDQWCVMLGENLAEGLAAFGDTPAAAMEAFDKAFWSQKTPEATRRSARESGK